MTGSKDEDSDRDHADESSRPDHGADREDGLDPAEVEQRFDAIVAHFDDTPRWPDEHRPEAEEPVDEASKKPADDAEQSSSTIEEEDSEPTFLELLDAEDPDDPDDPEANYVPPPPPPLPRPSFPAVLGMLMIVAGLTLVVSPGLIDVGETLGRFTGIVGFLAGAAVLVWRLRPDDPEEEEHPGNGAVT